MRPRLRRRGCTSSGQEVIVSFLRLLGFDHEKLTYRYNGRDFRLTDNFGKVVQRIIA